MNHSLVEILGINRTAEEKWRSSFFPLSVIATLQLLHPSFPETEVKKVLSRSIDGAKAAKDNPQAAIRQYFRAFFYGPAHPYGHPAEEASLTSITRANIAEYAARMYVGRNTVAIVAGSQVQCSSLSVTFPA